MRGTRFVSFIKKASTKVAIIEINGIGAILAAECSFTIKLETWFSQATADRITFRDFIVDNFRIRHSSKVMRLSSREKAEENEQIETISRLELITRRKRGDTGN